MSGVGVLLLLTVESCTRAFLGHVWIQFWIPQPVEIMAWAVGASSCVGLHNSGILNSGSICLYVSFFFLFFFFFFWPFFFLAVESGERRKIKSTHFFSTHFSRTTKKLQKLKGDGLLPKDFQRELSEAANSRKFHSCFS